MNGIKDALLRMVRAARETEALQKQYLEVGLDDNPVFEIWGNIVDAVYALVGEHTETVEESVTWTVLKAPILSDERRAEMLYAEHLKHNPEFKMPKPNILEREEMRKMVRENGGYMTPEGDWS